MNGNELRFVSGSLMGQLAMRAVDVQDGSQEGHRENEDWRWSIRHNDRFGESQKSADGLDETIKKWIATQGTVAEQAETPMDQAQEGPAGPMGGTPFEPHCYHISPLYGSLSWRKYIENYVAVNTILWSQVCGEYYSQLEAKFPWFIGMLASNGFR